VPVPAAVDRRGAAVRQVQPEYQPHRGRLARAVGPEEPGDPARLDGERQMVHGHLRAEALGQVASLDHPTPSQMVNQFPIPAGPCKAPGAARSPGPVVTYPGLSSRTLLRRMSQSRLRWGLLALIATAAASVLLGLLTGLIWSAVAPRALLVVQSRG